MGPMSNSCGEMPGRHPIDASASMNDQRGHFEQSRRGQVRICDGSSYRSRSQMEQAPDGPANHAHSPPSGDRLDDSVAVAAAMTVPALPMIQEDASLHPEATLAKAARQREVFSGDCLHPCYRPASASTLPSSAPNALFRHLAERDWDAAISRAAEAPHEASAWLILGGSGSSKPSRILALHSAAALGAPPDVVAALMRADPEAVRYPDLSGRTMLHWAVDAEGSDTSLAAPGVASVREDFVGFVLRAHPDLARVREHVHGCTPLHVACCRRRAAARGVNDGDAAGGLQARRRRPREDARREDEGAGRIVELLLGAFSEGALCRDAQRGWLPLHAATRHGAAAEVLGRLVVACPRAAGVVDRDGRLPLHFAARYAHLWVDNDHEGGGGGSEDEDLSVVLGGLIEAYPDSLKRREGKSGYTPLHTACSTSHPLSVMRILLARLLRSPGGEAALAIPDHDQRLPLHVAAQSGQSASVLRCLLSPNPTTAMDQDKDGRIALHWACHANAYPTCIDILLRAFPRGAAVVEGKYRWTPLHMAVRAGADGTVISTLLHHFPDGARIRDRNGSLPLHIACKNGGCVPVPVAGMLLHAYPEAASVKDKKGRTPLDLVGVARDQAWAATMRAVLGNGSTLIEV